MSEKLPEALPTKPPDAVPEMPSRSDIAIFDKAVKERWPISPEMRRRWVGILDEVAQNGDHRSRVAAIKAGLAADEQNLRAGGVPDGRWEVTGPGGRPVELSLVERIAARARELLKS